VYRQQKELNPMTRLMIAVTVTLWTLSPAAATLTPRNDRSPFSIVQLPERTKKPSAPRPHSGFRIVDGTEVLLNGRRCQYEDVPAHAVVILLEVAPDNRTVIRVHFQTRNNPPPNRPRKSGSIQDFTDQHRMQHLVKPGGKE
jgi:hypothetical protein